MTITSFHFAKRLCQVQVLLTNRLVSSAEALYLRFIQVFAPE